MGYLTYNVSVTIVFCFLTSLVFVQGNHAWVNLSVTHDISQSFDEGFEIRAIFFDIWKTFDKVWQEDHIYKLHQYGYLGNLLSFCIDFLINRKQRIVSNVQHSSLVDIRVGVPKKFQSKASIFFLVHINDLTES